MISAAKRKRTQPWESASDMGCMVTSFHPSEVESGAPKSSASGICVTGSNVNSTNTLGRHQHVPHHQPTSQHVTHAHSHSHSSHSHLPGSIVHSHMYSRSHSHSHSHSPSPPPHAHSHSHSHSYSHSHHSHSPSPPPHSHSHSGSHTHCGASHSLPQAPQQKPVQQQSPPQASASSPTLSLRLAEKRSTSDLSKYYLNLYSSGCGTAGCQCPCSGGNGPSTPGCDSSSVDDPMKPTRDSVASSNYYPFKSLPSLPSPSRSPRYGDYSDRSPHSPRSAMQHLSCSCLPSLTPLRSVPVASPTPNPSTASHVLPSPYSQSQPSSNKESSVLPSIAGLMESLSRSPPHDTQLYIGECHSASSPTRYNSSPDRTEYKKSPSDTESSEAVISGTSDRPVSPTSELLNATGFSAFKHEPGVASPSIMEPKFFGFRTNSLRGVV